MGCVKGTAFAIGLIILAMGVDAKTVRARVRVRSRGKGSASSSATATASGDGGFVRVGTLAATNNGREVKIEEKRAVLGTSEQSVKGFSCRIGQFKKEFPRLLCMDCDKNCLEDCVDGKGCVRCKDGYFTSKEDSEWPLQCRRCDIENCARCQDVNFNALPPTCAKCVEGYVKTQDGTRCRKEEQPPSGGSTGGSSDADVLEQSVPGGSDVSDPVETCREGSFFKPFDRSCMQCDQNCLPGQCFDAIGCQECAEGYFTSREDLEWPRRCKPCSIDGCTRCRSDIFDAWPMQCDVCLEGFSLSEDRRDCISVGEVFGEVTVQSVPGCDEGSFVKKFDGACMTCDENCLPGECADEVGCRKCRSGYYRSAPDREWPFTCFQCEPSIPNCAQCLDGVFDDWPVYCDRCSPGFRLANQNQECVPI